MLNTGASGAIPRTDDARMRQHAELYYDEIRKTDSDVAKIAQNSGLTIEEIRIIKQHIFFNEYELDGIVQRFDASYDIAVSWQRLIEGKGLKDMDLVLLKHELLEYNIMKEQNLLYPEAHAEATKTYNYAKYIKELDKREGIL
ncbi:MAG: hypothetical protein LBS74_08155 [Oscillospiraceae bacterium]|nr:hypothetical protein [Oscillospiraceae bacterium]